MKYHELKQLGLSENEIKVYIALLEIGTSKVDSISKRVPLPRTTIYGILKSLLEKGLCSYVVKSGIKYYEAIDPKRLYLMEQEKALALKKIIPDLEKIKHTIAEKPSIGLYEGEAGVKSVHEDMLKTKQPIYGYGNTELFFEFLQYYAPNFIKRRVKEGIKIHLITERSKTSIEMKKNDKKEKRETRFMEQMKEMAVATYIYGNKLTTMTLLKKEPIGIIIENKELSKSQKVLFDLLWKIAKK